MPEDIILSSPFFSIDPTESYVIGCNLGKSSSEAQTTYGSESRPLYTGVGVRLTFYDSNENIISPTGKLDEVFNHHPSDNHIITSSDSIPIITNTGLEGVNIVTSGRSLKKIIDHSDIPSSGGLAKLEAVAYDHFKGNFYWTNMFAKTVGDYYYATSGNSGQSNPTQTDSEKFNFTPPPPYDKKTEVVCEQFSTSREYTNSNNINATFLLDNVDSLNWKNPLSTYTGEWSETEDYEKNDYIQYSPSQRKNHDTYFYAKEGSTNIKPDLYTKWSNDYFQWLPSHQQSLSLSPNINKVELENKYTQRSEDGINANTLNFNSAHNDREDKEAAAISHFLYHKLGYQPFEALLPRSFSNRNLPEITGELISTTGIQISGEQTSTVELSQALSVPLEVGGLEVDQEIVFDSVQSTHNKVYLASGAQNGSSQIRVRSIEYADIPSGSSFKIFPSKSRFYCPSWTHTWTFKDNNSISADFIEFPFMKSKPIGTSGFLLNPTSLNYNTKSVFSTKDKKVNIRNTGIASLTLENIDIKSDGEFSLSSSSNESKYQSISLPFEIEGLSSKQVYVRYRPTGLSSAGVTGSGIFTIEGQESGILLTGNSDSNFIVTGAELESEAHDIQPSGLTQIILTDGSANEPIDLLVWKH